MDGRAVSPEDQAFFKKVKARCDDHTFRYAKVDFLYWSEFQNKCSDFMQSFVAFLNQFESNQDILKSEEAQQILADRLGHLSTMMVALFDLINCERCTNISYFALMDDLIDIFQRLLQMKIIAVEEVLTQIVDVIDSVLVYCASTKQALKYGYKHEQLKAFIVSVIEPFLGQFLDQARQLSKVSNKRIETQLMEAKAK